MTAVLAGHGARRAAGRGVCAAVLPAPAAVVGGAPGPATKSFTTRVIAPPGIAVIVQARGWYGEGAIGEGTNPRITEATFSTTAYCDLHEIRDGRLWVQAKTAADLNALSAPPPDPFEVTVDVSMTNDEDRIITGTITFETRYLRTATTPVPSDGEQTTGRDGG